MTEECQDKLRQAEQERDYALSHQKKVEMCIRDRVISDELNHASIIDGVRLCKAKRFRYKNNDMEDLDCLLYTS